MAAEGVSLDLDIDKGQEGLLTDNLPGKKDRPRTRPPEFHASLKFTEYPVFELENVQESCETGALAPRYDQSRKTGEIRGFSYPNGTDAETPQVIEMLGNVSLEIKHADTSRRALHLGGYHPRVASIWVSGISEISTPGMASPRPLEASRTFAGSL